MIANEIINKYIKTKTKIAYDVRNLKFVYHQNTEYEVGVVPLM